MALLTITKQRGTGHTQEMDLIFEKEVNEN